jgi:hypothetical protein
MDVSQIIRPNAAARALQQRAGMGFVTILPDVILVGRTVGSKKHF